MIVDLPLPVGPDHAHRLAGFDGEAYVTEHGALLVIGEGYMIEDNCAPNRLLARIRLFRELSSAWSIVRTRSTATVVWAMELFMLARSFTGLKNEAR